MTNLSNFQNNSRFLLAETIWLEPEQIEQAKAISHHVNEELTSEVRRWQHYLNALGLIGFEQWLEERLSGRLIERSPHSISHLSEFVSYLQVDEFSLCLITVEHVLDETVKIPQSVVEKPTQTAHFYVMSEVSEEQELVTIRGFLRFDELIQYRDRHHLYPQDGYYQFPLAALDAEPNHLPLYCQFLEPSAIALPVHSALITAEQSFVATLTETTRLTQWFQNTIDESWQAIDQLINPEAYLSLSTRNIALGVKRGKLINFGLQLGQQTIALLMSVTSEADGKLGVLVQLHPTGTVQYLMPELKLVLRSPKGQTLQEVFSRSQDNYIQLKPFKGKAGTRFSVAIYSGGELAAEENFEL